jgi:hypothetical protein
MDLIIRKPNAIQDPLLRHLSEYVDVVGMDITDDIITDLPSLFSFLVSRMEIYLQANSRNYRKPAGFQLVFNQPSHCPHSIKISCGIQFITIQTP